MAFSAGGKLGDLGSLVAYSYRGLVFLLVLALVLMYFFLLSLMTSIPVLGESREVYLKTDSLSKGPKILVVLAKVDNQNWFSYHLIDAQIELRYKGHLLGKKTMDSLRFPRRKTEKIEFQIALDTDKFPKMEMGADMVFGGGVQFDLRMRCKSNWIPGWMVQMEQGIFVSREEFIKLVF